MTLISLLSLGAGALGVATLATFALPRHVEVIRQAEVAVPPGDVLALAASNQGYQRFNPYMSADPALKITLFGPAEGVGSGFHFEGRDGKGSQTVASVDAKTVRYFIDLGPMGQPEQSITATPSESGSLVTWRMTADMGMNPIGRVMGLFMDRMLGDTFQQGLTNLAQEI